MLTFSTLRRLALAISAYGGAAAFAQEQTFNIPGPTAILTDTSYLNLEQASMTFDGAEQFIDATLGAAARQTPHFYAIIHVLRWDETGKVALQNWYLYSKENGWSDLQGQGLRIYGSHNVAVLFVHINAKGAAFQTVATHLARNRVILAFTSRFGVAGPNKRKALQAWLAGSTLGFSEEQRTTLITALPAKPLTGDDEARRIKVNAQIATDLEDETDGDLENLYLQTQSASINAATAVEMARLAQLTTGQECGGKSLGRDLVKGPGADSICVARPFIETSYKVDVTKKLPSAIGDLLMLIGMNSSNTSNDVAMSPVALWGGRRLSIGPVPSDVKVTPSVTEEGKAKLLESRTYDNEGRYYWDISAGIPLRSIKDTSYDSATTSLLPKKIEKQSLYAAVNLFPFAVDTKGTNVRWLTPMILVGMGITERPLDRVMVAAGLGLNKIQFFVGTAITKKSFPGPASDPAAVTQAYRTNMIFGLNIPLRQVVKALKAPK